MVFTFDTLVKRVPDGFPHTVIFKCLNSSGFIQEQGISVSPWSMQN